MKMWCVTITSTNIGLTTRRKKVITTYAVMAETQQESEEKAAAEHGGQYDVVVSEPWGGDVVEFRTEVQ